MDPFRRGIDQKTTDKNLHRMKSDSFEEPNETAEMHTQTATSIWARSEKDLARTQKDIWPRSGSIMPDLGQTTRQTAPAHQCPIW